MTRWIALAFVAACGGAPPQVATTYAPAPTTVAPPTPTMQIARPTYAAFTNAILVAYGAMIQSDTGWDSAGFALRPRTIDQSLLAPRSVVPITDVECRVEDVVGSPFKATCSNRRPRAVTDETEKAFRDRFAACFRASTVDLPPQALYTIEASIHKGALLPGAKPTSTTPFITLAVDAHIVEKPPLVPIYDESCAKVLHGCDGVPRVPIGYQPPDPAAKNVESQTHVFAGYGPEGYEVLPNVPPPGALFRPIGVGTIYAAPMLAGEKPDPRFVVQRFPWEPPTLVSEAAVKETYDRIAALDLERENDATRTAIFFDRAVLAYALRNGEAGRRHMQDLDAWLARHPDALPNYDYAKHGLETLHLLARGALTVTDPCAPASK
jgi:hypothetical protein